MGGGGALIAAAEGAAAPSGSLLDPIVAVLVVANVIPILPVVLDVVSPLSPRDRRNTALRALLFGNAVALAFAAGGGALLGALATRLDDLRIAGGLILLIFAIHDLLFSREQRKEALSELSEEVKVAGHVQIGLVPLAIPILVGPSTLATVLIIAETRDLLQATVALGVNLALNATILISAGRVMRLLGPGTVRATGKVFGLVLAAMAVAMIRNGIVNVSRTL